VVASRDVIQNLHTAGKISIFSKTPSIGGVWSTHPSLKYLSDNNDILGQRSVFSKVSSEKNILVERDNLNTMGRYLSVPKVLGVYRNREEDLSDLHEMKPGCHIGAVLVEEFIDSVSLGQAVVEEKIDMEEVVEGVLGILKAMHTFCVHRDLKHSHIRINLDPYTSENLTFGRRQCLNLEIMGFSVIDVETTEMRESLSESEFEANVQRDITQLLTSITGYMSTLELDTDLMKRIFPTPLDRRLQRFGMLLDVLKEEYVVELADRLMVKSRTTEFMVERLGS
jgi:hypothetical protein